MEFRKIGLIWNPTKTSGFEVARELREILAERGLSVTTGITLAHALGAPELAEGSFDECDLLMVLGASSENAAVIAGRIHTRFMSRVAPDAGLLLRYDVYPMGELPLQPKG